VLNKASSLRQVDAKNIGGMVTVEGIGACPAPAIRSCHALSHCACRAKAATGHSSPGQPCACLLMPRFCRARSDPFNRREADDDRGNLRV